MWRQPRRIDEDLDAARDALLTFYQVETFEGQNHLVDGGRGDLEVALHVGLGGRASVGGYRPI